MTKIMKYNTLDYTSERFKSNPNTTLLRVVFPKNCFEVNNQALEDLFNNDALPLMITGRIKLG
jgi:hypothetical protein